MTPFEANFGKILIRFYLMMAIVIVAGFTGYWALGLLALPIFLTAILGFGEKKKQVKRTLLKAKPTVVKSKAA